MEIKTVEKIKLDDCEDKAWDVIYELCLNIKNQTTNEDIEFYAGQVCEHLDFLADFLEE